MPNSAFKIYPYGRVFDLDPMRSDRLRACGGSVCGPSPTTDGDDSSKEKSQANSENHHASATRIESLFWPRWRVDNAHGIVLPRFREDFSVQLRFQQTRSS